jgi:RimJ/RimL family protein N-acetyltransferase
MRAADAGPYAEAFRVDRELGRLLGMDRDPDEESVRARIDRGEGRLADGAAAELAIADARTDGFLGSVIWHSYSEQHRRCELGFWLVPAARGRGAATRAVALAIRWSFGSLDLLRVEMTTTPDNAGVPGLARRLGFTNEGVMRKRNIERGERVDIVTFGLLREDERRGA